MGHDLETLARRFVDAYNARDSDALAAVSHPEIAFCPSTLAGARRRYDGHDGLRERVGHLSDERMPTEMGPIPEPPPA